MRINGLQERVIRESHTFVGLCKRPFKSFLKQFQTRASGNHVYVLLEFVVYIFQDLSLRRIPTKPKKLISLNIFLVA